MRVAVIGAGPAGSIASILVARCGTDVTLVEQHKFPRDKVCGECLSALGISVLGRLRLSVPLLKAHHPAILRRTILFGSDNNSAEINLPRPMWGISRSALDKFLLDAAQAAGARIILPARCESVEPNLLRLRMLESNQLREIEADLVLLADGKAALLPDSPPMTSDLGLKAHFTGIDAPADAIELFGVEGHYGGIAPIEGGGWNIAFSVPTARIKKVNGDLDRLFLKIINENPALVRQMRSALRVGQWLTSPLPRFGVADRWPRGMIPIGNAAAALEPIGGEGMGLAMRSAELATDAIMGSIKSGTPLDLKQLRSEYRKLWNLRRLACRVGAKIISSAALSRLGIPLAARGGDRGPGALALRLIGK
jgi:flavin-dependent dehydrogenase